MTRQRLDIRLYAVHLVAPNLVASFRRRDNPGIQVLLNFIVASNEQSNLVATFEDVLVQVLDTD